MSGTIRDSEVPSVTVTICDVRVFGRVLVDAVAPFP